LKGFLCGFFEVLRDVYFYVIGGVEFVFGLQQKNEKTEKTEKKIDLQEFLEFGKNIP
jgi:hypothetical protein